MGRRRRERRRERERKRERESVPPPPPPQFAVCYVSDSEVESQSCSSGGSQPLKQTPGVFSHPSPLPSSLTRVCFSPEPWKLLFLSFSTLLLPLDSGQQFGLWDLVFYYYSVVISTLFLAAAAAAAAAFTHRRLFWICSSLEKNTKISEVDPWMRLFGSNWRWKC